MARPQLFAPQGHSRLQDLKDGLAQVGEAQQGMQGVTQCVPHTGAPGPSSGPHPPALAPHGEAQAGEGALLEPLHRCLSQLKRAIPEAGLFPTAAGAAPHPRPTEQAREKMLVQALRADRPAGRHPACPSATSRKGRVPVLPAWAHPT